VRAVRARAATSLFTIASTSAAQAGLGVALRPEILARGRIVVLPAGRARLINRCRYIRFYLVARPMNRREDEPFVAVYRSV